MSSTSEVTNGDRREQLEHRAAEVRRRLEQRLDVIDDRRQQLTAIARAAIRPPVSVVLIAAAGAVTTALVVRGIRRRRSREQSWAALLAPAQEPAREGGLFANAFKKAALSLIAVAVQRLGTRGLDLLLAEAPAVPPVPVPPRPRPSTPAPNRT
jgi:hypothetical protein